MRRFRLFLITTIIFGSIVSLNVQAQLHTLPVDLIVTVAQRDGYHNTIARVDAKTLILTDFYTNADLKGIIPISWSPNGQLLSIAQHFGGGSFQLCLLNSVGVLQKCMAERPFWGGNEYGDSQLDALSWSADSTKLYYAVESSDSFRLVEADVLTGKTIQVIFEIPKSDALPYGVMAWSLTQEYVVIGNHFDPPPYSYSMEIASLNSTQMGQRKNALSVIPRNELNRICARSSPKGSYFAVLVGVVGNDGEGFNPSATSIWLLNSQGQIIHYIEPLVAVGKLSINTCPFWQSDEQSLYFSAFDRDNSTVGIYRYALNDRQLMVWHTGQQNSLSGGVVSPLSIYYDGRAIAGHSVKRPISGGNSQVVVGFPDGYELIIIGNYYESRSPLWVPPLDE